jgi:hypothetical protein
MTILRSTILLLIGLLTLGAHPAAGQSTDMHSYALLATEELRADGVHVRMGNLGVTHGILSSSRPLDAPASEVAAETVRLAPGATCTMLFTNGLAGSSCGTPRPFAGIVDDVAEAAAFPASFPCTTIPLPPVRPLPPGQYGALVLRDGDTLTLAGDGDYAFCSIRAARRSRLEVKAPATIRVRDALSFGNGSFIGPAGAGLVPADIELFFAGEHLRLGRRSDIGARLYAPQASLHIDNGATLNGSFVARRIRVGRVTIVSTGGGVVPTTTTTTSATTSTTRRSTTSTTKKAPTTTTSSTTTTTQPIAIETCGNCVDDDGNGLTDFEDPACCAESFALTLRRARIRPRGSMASRVRLKTILAQRGLENVNPMAEDVFVQLRPADGTDIFCAKVPAARFERKLRGFKFADPEHRVASALHLDSMRIRVRRDGSVRLRTRGKEVLLRSPAQGRLHLTVGFRNPTRGDAANRCSSAFATLRAGRGGRLIAP